MAVAAVTGRGLTLVPHSLGSEEVSRSDGRGRRKEEPIRAPVRGRRLSAGHRGRYKNC